MKPLLDIEGFFWIRDAPERRVRGRLQWSRQKGTLELDEPLRPTQDASTDSLDEVLGISMLGDELLLSDCFVNQLSGVGVRNQQIWTVNGTLVGTFAPVSNVAAVDLRIDGMREFYGSRSVTSQHEETDYGTEVTIGWRSAPVVSIQLPRVEVTFSDAWEVSGTASNVSLTATPSVRFAPVDGEPLPDDWEAMSGALMTLVGLCSDNDVDISETWITSAEDVRVQRFQGRRHVVPKLDPKPWLALGNLQPLTDSLPRWFSFCEELPKAVAMIAEYLRAGPATPWEDRLLYLARVIEQYHRARHDAPRLEKSEFKQRRRTIRDALDDELGQWVMDLTQHSNDRHLAERLNELVEIHAEALSGALGADASVFGAKVADTRNYYTHYGSHLADKAAAGFELVILTRRLWALVRVCLLAEMGFDPAKTAGLLAFDSEVNWLSAQ